MSHYNEFETTITDPHALIKALCRVGNPHNAACIKTWNPNQIEYHEKATHLYGYQNDRRTQTANVIVRRQNVAGASNDLGFVRGEDGKYRALVSDYDKNCGITHQWLTKLYTYYNVEKSKMALDAKGLEYEETKDVKGRIQLRAKFAASCCGPVSRVRVKVGR